MVQTNEKLEQAVEVAEVLSLCRRVVGADEGLLARCRGLCERLEKVVRADAKTNDLSNAEVLVALMAMLETLALNIADDVAKLRANTQTSSAIN